MLSRSNQQHCLTSGASHLAEYRNSNNHPKPKHQRTKRPLLTMSMPRRPFMSHRCRYHQSVHSDKGTHQFCLHWFHKF